jgi:hypothetical protein
VLTRSSSFRGKVPQHRPPGREHHSALVLSARLITEWYSPHSKCTPMLQRMESRLLGQGASPSLKGAVETPACRDTTNHPVSKSDPPK